MAAGSTDEPATPVPAVPAVPAVAVPAVAVPTVPVPAAPVSGAAHLDSGNIARARSSTVTKPVVRSATARGKLASSLRRLGADDGTVHRLTGRPALLR